MRTRTLCLALVAAVVLLPASARADGLPVLDGAVSWYGVTTPRSTTSAT